MKELIDPLPVKWHLPWSQNYIDLRCRQMEPYDILCISRHMRRFQSPMAYTDYDKEYFTKFISKYRANEDVRIFLRRLNEICFLMAKINHFPVLEI